MTSISPPVYEQIAQAIRRQILDGDLPPGSRLPSESILCERFSVTRGTVRRALQVLTHEGHLRSYQGKGTFVTAQDDKRILWGFGSLTDRLQGSSDQARARVIEHGVVTRQNRPFLRLKRLRLIESNTGVFPVSLDLSFIPIDLLPGIQDIDFTDLSIYHVLRDIYKSSPKFSVVSLRAQSIDQETRTILGEPAGTRCLLHLTGSTYDHNGACIEESEVTYSTRVQATMTIDQVRGHAEPLTLNESASTRGRF